MVERVSPRDLADSLAPDGPIVVDTRSPATYAEGHVPGAVSYPFAVGDDLDVDAFREGIGATDEDRIVTVCGTGKSSTALAEALDATGFDAAVVDGGMAAWADADGPLQRGQCE